MSLPWLTHMYCCMSADVRIISLFRLPCRIPLSATSCDVHRRCYMLHSIFIFRFTAQRFTVTNCIFTLENSYQFVDDISKFNVDSRANGVCMASFDVSSFTNSPLPETHGRCHRRGGDASPQSKRRRGRPPSIVTFIVENSE